MVYNDFTVNELIIDVLTDFLYLYGTDFENIRGRDMTRGIKLFNEIINEDSVPLLHSLSLDVQQGIDDYYINATEVAGIKLSLEGSTNAVVNLIPLSEYEYLNSNFYFNSSVSDNKTGRPVYYRYIKQGFIPGEDPQGNNVLLLYPTPDKDYQCYVDYRPGQSILLTQDNVFDKLSLPVEWGAYLRYALARKFKDYFPNAKWTQAMEAEYQTLSSLVSWQYNKDTLTKTDGALRNYWGRGNYGYRGYLW